MKSILRDSRFWALFWTQFCGAFNDNFFKNAILILFTFRGVEIFGVSSGMMGALLGGVFILPYFLFSASSGQIADKYEKVTLIRWIKMAEILFMLMGGLGFVFHEPLLLLATLFAMGIHSTFFGPIKYSILPQLVRRDQLVSANANIEMGTFVAILLGSIAGGLLVSADKSEGILSGGLLFVAIVGYIFSRFIPRTPAEDKNLILDGNIFRLTFRVLSLTRENKSVFVSVIAISWFWFFGAVFIALFSSYTKDILSANEYVGVLFLAVFSIGIGIGSIFCGKISKGQLKLTLVPVGSLGMSLFAADLYFVGRPWKSALVFGLKDFLEQLPSYRILFDLGMISIFAGIFIVPLYTLIQMRTEEGSRSRVIAGNNIWNSLFMVASSFFVMGLLAFHFTIPAIFLSLSVLNLVICLFIFYLVPEFIHGVDQI